jgi:hypothetical protein
VEDAQEHAIDLLEARCFQRALEGDLEPVYYMGVVVDYVRKFDSRLAIELLKANRPDKFKTPGTQVKVATRGDVFMLTEEQRHELMRLNRQWLEAHPPEKAVSQDATAESEAPTQETGHGNGL